MLDVLPTNYLNVAGDKQNKKRFKISIVSCQKIQWKTLFPPLRIFWNLNTLNSHFADELQSLAGVERSLLKHIIPGCQEMQQFITSALSSWPIWRLWPFMKHPHNCPLIISEWIWQGVNNYALPVPSGVIPLIECTSKLFSKQSRGWCVCKNAWFASALQGTSLPFKVLCKFRMTE